ncbi:hypothetical protein IW16_06345 [Chryseobacterium vrystaatense]|uniref:Transposase zinc-ribbon domain-containing protein n=1 Tax=Chryseobacterium vrystaatense TaxID=307480 RepID=A0ABR4UP54_9FLAO|nr:hypothetical protein IW16_06345 [Chryseobacterium vrystaatense]
MNKDIQAFINSYKNKPYRDFSISELVTKRGDVSFDKLLKEHNHEIWKKCNCGNEEDLRQTWHCSLCGAVLFTPKQK